MKKAHSEELLKEVKKQYILAFEDDFDSSKLDDSKWIPYYLPHWSSKEEAAANYEIRDGNLVLKITDRQQSCCPILNPGLKCSNVQTGVFSGKIGTHVGQHRFNENCIVREEQVNQRLYTPHYGYFEIRAKANIASSNMVAFWMIGYEDKPQYAGEICVMEIFGKQIEGDHLINGSGVHPFGDNNLKDEFYYDKLRLDISKFHTYSVEWRSEFIKHYVDNKEIRTVEQSPNYPMQLMIDIFEFPEEEKSIENLYPKEFIIDYVRGYKMK